MDDGRTYVSRIQSTVAVSHGAFTGYGLVDAEKAVFPRPHSRQKIVELLTDSQATDCLKVAVERQERRTVFEATCRNPKIVARDRLSLTP